MEGIRGGCLVGGGKQRREETNGDRGVNLEGKVGCYL